MSFENPHEDYIEIEKPIEREKFSEEVLNEKRREFAKKELEIESQGLKGKKIEDIEKAQETALVENDYRDVLKGQRKELLEKIPEKERKEKSQEILIKTVAEEATKLYDTKTELKLEGKRDSKFEKIKNVAGRAVDRYRKLPLSKKLLVSAVLFAGGIGAGAIGGAAGAALATGVITGRWFQRVFGGAATAVGLEGLIKKSQEKEERKEVVEEFRGNILGILEKENSRLDQKIFELEAGKKGKERRRYALAGATGVLVGSGAVARATQNVFHLAGDAYHKFFGGSAKISPEVIKPQTEIPSEAAQKPIIPETSPIKSNIEMQPESPVEIDYQGGKSIWQEAGKQWETRFKEFAGLGGSDSEAAEALKTYNIDRIKDTVADAIKSGDKDLMEKYGLADISDPDNITVDQLKGVKWNNVFEDTLKEKGLVENLPSEQVESIAKNNATLREFFKEYPTAPRTSENYENILRGEGATGVVSEATPAPEAPETEPKPAVETKPAFEEKIAGLDKQITDVQDEYAKARLKLLEADVNRYTSDLSPEELKVQTDSAYEKVEDLENQLKDLTKSKEELLKLQDAEIKTAPEIPPEAKVEVKGAAETIAPILSGEKQNFLDNLIYKDDHLVGFKVKTLVEQIKSDKLTAEDFSKYYADKLGAERVSENILTNLKNNFKAIIEGNAAEKLKAQRAMEVILQKLKSIR